MILDVRLSAIGKATEVQLNTLRRKLGVGCDPCYDYSGRQEVQRSLRHCAAGRGFQWRQAGGISESAKTV
eukprot:g8474.t1